MARRTTPLDHTPAASTARVGPFSGKPSRERLFLASLRIRIPPGLWTGVFSREHPEVQLEALNRGDLGSGISVSDYWISGGDPGGWAPELSRHSDVLRVESLAQVGDGCLYRIAYRNPPIIDLYRELRLPVPFPLRIQDGVIEWEVAARYADFERILRFARRRDREARVVSIRRGPLRSHIPTLSVRQQQLLAQAMDAGYFAVPRGISLTALARRLKRSKSSVSESIATIEEKLLETTLRPGPRFG